MTNAQHTPGPWWPSQNTAGAWCVLTYRDHQTPHEAGAIASAYGASICSNIGDHTEQRTRGNEAANARLIAEAPAMLEALRTVSGKIGSYHDAETASSRAHIISDIEASVSAILARIDGEAAQ